MFGKNRKGIIDVGSGVAAVIGVVVIVLMIFIGMSLYGGVRGSIDVTTMPDYNDTGDDTSPIFTNVETNTNAGFNLLALSPLVLAMVAIITILIGGIGYMFMRGR